MTELMESGDAFEPQPGPAPFVYKLAEEEPELDAAFPPKGVSVHQMNGVTWTTKDASLEIVERLDKLYGHSRPPMCGDGVGNGCGATTCYILVEKPLGWIRKAGGVWLMRPVSAIVGHLMDGVLYIPVTKCHRCGAASDGWLCGYRDPQDKQHYIQQATAAALLPSEREEYLTVFERAFRKGRDAKIQSIANQSKSKYQERIR